MKNTLKLCLCFLVFFWTTNISAQQKSTTQSSIKTIEKNQLKKEASGERATAIQKRQKLKVEKATIQQPKTTVIYSNQIEHSSAPQLTRISKKTSTKKPMKKAMVKQTKQATPQMIQLKKWKEQLEESKRFVEELKGENLEEGSELHLQFKKHQEEISKMEAKIAKQHSLIQMK